MLTKKTAGELKKRLNTTLASLKQLCESSSDLSEIASAIRQTKKFIQSVPNDYYQVKKPQEISQNIEEIQTLLTTLESRLITMQANLAGAIQKNANQLLRVLNIPIADVSKDDWRLLKKLKDEFHELNLKVSGLNPYIQKQIIEKLNPEAHNLDEKISLFESQVLEHQSKTSETARPDEDNEPEFFDTLQEVDEVEDFDHLEVSDVADIPELTPIIKLDPWVLQLVAIFALATNAYTALNNAISKCKNVIKSTHESLAEDFENLFMPNDPPQIDEDTEPEFFDTLQEVDEVSDMSKLTPIIKLDLSVLHMVSIFALATNAYSALNNAISKCKNVIKSTPESLAEDLENLFMPNDPPLFDEDDEPEFFDDLQEDSIKSIQETLRLVIQSKNYATKEQEFNALISRCDQCLEDPSKISNLKLEIKAEKLAWQEMVKIRAGLIEEMDKKLRIAGIKEQPNEDRLAFIAALENSDFRIDIFKTDSAHVKQEFLKVLGKESAFVNAQKKLLQKIGAAVDAKLKPIRDSAVFLIHSNLHNPQKQTTFKKNLAHNVSSYIRTHYPDINFQLLTDTKNLSSIDAEGLKNVYQQIEILEKPKHIPALKIKEDDIKKILSAMTNAIHDNCFDITHDNEFKQTILSQIKDEFKNAPADKKLLYLKLFLKVANTHRWKSYGIFHIPGVKTQTLKEFEKSAKNLSYALKNFISEQIDESLFIDKTSSPSFKK
jgi:hypothetical protein